jgi:hypothetical protein
MFVETIIAKGYPSSEYVENGLREEKVPEVLIAALIGSWEAIDKYFKAVETESVEREEKQKSDTIAKLKQELPYCPRGVFEVDSDPWQFLGYSLTLDGYVIRAQKVGSFAKIEIQKPKDYLYFENLDDYNTYRKAKEAGTQHTKRS